VGDTARTPLFGGIDLDLWELKHRGNTDEATLRARVDTVYPEVLVTDRRGVHEGKPWRDVTLWIGSVVNSRDGTMALDGAGYDVSMTGTNASGFVGRWGPAGIARTDTGYFCATRM
jgi:hypothetical protein